MRLSPLLLLAALAACEPPAAKAPLKVLATHQVVADAISWVGGSRFVPVAVFGPGSDPFRDPVALGPGAQFRAAVGMGTGWEERIIGSQAFVAAEAPYLTLADPRTTDKGGQAYWTNPLYMEALLRMTAEALTTLRPREGEGIQARLEEALQSLEGFNVKVRIHKPPSILLPDKALNLMTYSEVGVDLPLYMGITPTRTLLPFPNSPLPPGGLAEMLAGERLAPDLIVATPYAPPELEEQAAALGVRVARVPLFPSDLSPAAASPAIFAEACWQALRQALWEAVGETPPG